MCGKKMPVRGVDLVLQPVQEERRFEEAQGAQHGRMRKILRHSGAESGRRNDDGLFRQMTVGGRETQHVIKPQTVGQAVD